jgi:para-aminobenzoate synthetase component 1
MNYSKEVHFREKAGDNTFPIVESFPFYDDPCCVFSNIKDQSYPFFLDSGMTAYGIGRYSFIGFAPFLIFKSKNKNIEIIEEGYKKNITGMPFDILRNIINNYTLIPTFKGLPPFIGGGVGYFSYELRTLIEDVPATGIDDLNIPNCIVCFYDIILAFDNKNNMGYIISTGFPEKHTPSRYTRALSRIKYVKKILNNISYTEQTYNHVVSSEVYSIISNFTQEEYIQAVIKAKEYIASGDIYQVNLSQRLTTRLFIPPFELYKRLRELNPAPFGAYLDLDDIIIASSSPERFLFVEGNTVETRPIKGTRPRGETKIEDDKFKDELIRSEKDKAELIMIVDLLRNDIGKVCRYGSIKVNELRRLETYPTVFHTVSTITGELLSDKDRFDLLKACFPGGSITGAPKIRAMEIIDELEPTKRHIYTGSIGYLSFSGNMDLSIVIRTFLIKDNQVYFQVGGGIVADSEPEEEYNETLHKGRALIETLRSFTV